MLESVPSVKEVNRSVSSRDEPSVGISMAALIPLVLSKCIGVSVAVCPSTEASWEGEVVVAGSWYCELRREHVFGVKESEEMAGSVTSDRDCERTGGGGLGVVRASWASVLASRS